RAYEAERAESLRGARAKNEEVDIFETAYASGEHEAIVTYCSMVLERSMYPEGFHQEFRLAYTPESKELVIDYELPRVDVVPMESEYRYNKTKDILESKKRKASEVKEI